MDDKGGKEMAEIRLRTLFVTCKSQWNGDLSRFREAESTLKATQNALQILLQQVGSRYKENEKQMKKLQKQLSEITIHLSKPLEEQQRNAEETKNLLQTYSELLADSKMSAKKTSDQLAAFSSVRHAVVSMEIKTSDGEKLAAPLFDSALLNFPAEGANDHESHLLTSLSFLILSGTQNKQWEASAQQKNPSESIKIKTKELKAEAAGNENKEKPTRKDKKEGKAEKNGKQEVDPKKLNENVTKGGKDPRQKPLFLPAKTDKSRYNSKPMDHEKKPYQTNAPKQGHFNADKFPRNPNHHQHSYHAPTQAPILPPPNVFRVPELPLSLPSNVYHVPPPTMAPSLLPVHHKKAFLNLAVNGKQYGKIIIELRPDVAPLMSQKFLQCCLSKEGDSYQGTVIYSSKPKTFIMGGRLPGPESIYMADASPLKKTRGSIFFRLKRDFVKTQCSIVSTDFCIHLGEEMAENYRTSTVFGYVCDGLAVCDAISHMNCDKDHVAVSSAGLE